MQSRGRPAAAVAAPGASLRVPLPRVWPVIGFDIMWVLLANGAIIVAMWVRHGGLDGLAAPGAAFTAIGQLTGLFAAYLSLVQLVLMSRSPWLDQVFGLDRLAWAHRWLGFATVWLIVAHGILTILGYSIGDHASFLGETWMILTTFDWVALSVLGFAVFLAVGISSVRAARSRLSYEAWFLLHLLAYAAIALGFLHQLSVGADFMHDPLASAYWIALYVATAVLVAAFRLGQPIWLNLRHRLRVADVVNEGNGVASIYITGEHLDKLPTRAGQWFVWRFMAGPRWWSGHPFSLSAAPNGRWLRITVKALGDDTRSMQRLRPGTRVWAEGPYGILTGARRTRRKVTLIAGGIGIAPLRALLEALSARPGELTLLYRARQAKHRVLRQEIEALAATRGARVEYLVGRRGSAAMPEDPLAPDNLWRIVPDICEQDVYICGPGPMMDRVEQTLHQLRVPRSQVHVERFEY